MTAAVVFRLGEFFGRLDPSLRGGVAPDFMPMLFDRRTVGPEHVFDLSKPDDKLKAVHRQTGALWGADGTEHGGNICDQFYGKPGTDRGPYESPIGFQVDGIPAIAVAYTRPDGSRYLSACLTVFEL